MVLTALSFAPPVVMLGLGLWWTRRLVSDPEVTWPPAPARALATVVPNLLTTLPVFVAWLVLTVTRSMSPVWSAALLGWLGLGLAWGVRRLSRRRLAARAVVANFVGGPAFLAAFLLAVPHESPAASALAGFAILPVLVYAAWATRPLSRLWPLGMLALVPLGLLLWNGLWPHVRPDVEVPDAVHWVERFDASTEDLSGWESYGRTVAWLRERDVEAGTSAEARASVRHDIREGFDLHPSTLVGALDAGLLRPEDVARVRTGRSLYAGRNLLAHEGSIVFSIGVPAAIRLLLASGTLTAEDRVHLVDRLAASWPENPEAWRIGDVDELIQAMALVGAEERIQAHRAELRDVLRRAYVRTPPRYQAAGGFDPFPGGNDAPHATVEATWRALAIARHVGVPGDVDLGQTAVYLYEASRPYGWWIDGGPALDSSKRDAQLAWLRLRTEHGLRAPAWIEPGTATLLASALALALLALWVILRSPRATIVRRTIPLKDVQQTFDRMAKKANRRLGLWRFLPRGGRRPAGRGRHDGA